MLPHLLSCCSTRVPCESSASDLVSDEEVHIPCMHGDLVLLLQVPHLQTDEVPIRCFSPRSALVSCDSYDEVPIPCPRLPRLSSFTFPAMFALNLPRRLAAIADAFLGMVNIYWLLLVLAHFFPALSLVVHTWLQE
jgi:hypothetical protein